MSDKQIGREIGQALGANLTRRSLFALGGAAAVTGALAACGSNTGREPAATGGASGGGSGATINQWYHQYGEAGTQQAVEKYAAAYKDATVKVSWKPGDYDQSTAASLLTDAGPDVFEYGNGPTIDMIKGGQVVDLTDLIGDTKSDFNPSILERMTYDGKTYAIPQVVDMQLLVYRKSMLDKAGVTPPQTIDELIAAAKKLTQGNVKGLFLGNDGGAGLMGGPMLWSAGLDYLTKDNQFGFDDPRAATALGKLREMWDAKVLLLGAPKDWFDAVGAHRRPDGHAVHRPVDLPRHQEGPRRRLRRHGLAGARRQRQGLGARRRLRLVRQRQEQGRRGRQEVRQVAVDRPDRRTSSTSRRPTASTSRRARASSARRRRSRAGRRPRRPSSPPTSATRRARSCGRPSAPRPSVTR